MCYLGCERYSNRSRGTEDTEKMRVTIQSRGHRPLQERHTILGRFIDGVDIRGGSPIGFKGLLLSPIATDDGSLVLDVPKMQFGGKHRLVELSCLSEVGPAHYYRQGSGWSVVLASPEKGHNGLEKKLDFPEDSPAMDVYLEGAEVIVSSFVDPNLDSDILCRGPVIQAAREYQNLKEMGVVEQLERGEMPKPISMDDPYGYVPGR